MIFRERFFIFSLFSLIFQLVSMPVAYAETTSSNVSYHETNLSTHPSDIPDDHLLVIFGGSGDLAQRKLMPALASLAQSNKLPAHFKCVAMGRLALTDEEFRHKIFQGLQQLAPASLPAWESIKDRVVYFQGDYTSDNDYRRLNSFLNELDALSGTNGNRLYYLATPGSSFPIIIEKLHNQKLVYDIEQEPRKWSRVVIEKPFGHDTKSAQQLKSNITKNLSNNQIYLIDHYLEKKLCRT